MLYCTIMLVRQERDMYPIHVLIIESHTDKQEKKTSARTLYSSGGKTNREI